MFRSRFFNAYYWLARFWRGSTTPTPTVPLGWVVYPLTLHINRSTYIPLHLTRQNEIELPIVRLKEF